MTVAASCFNYWFGAASLGSLFLHADLASIGLTGCSWPNGGLVETTGSTSQQLEQSHKGTRILNDPQMISYISFASLPRCLGFCFRVLFGRPMPTVQAWLENLQQTGRLPICRLCFTSTSSPSISRSSGIGNLYGALRCNPSRLRPTFCAHNALMACAGSRSRGWRRRPKLSLMPGCMSSAPSCPFHKLFFVHDSLGEASRQTPPLITGVVQILGLRDVGIVYWQDRNVKRRAERISKRCGAILKLQFCGHVVDGSQIAGDQSLRAPSLDPTSCASTHTMRTV